MNNISDISYHERQKVNIRLMNEDDRKGWGYGRFPFYTACYMKNGKRKGSFNTEISINKINEHSIYHFYTIKGEIREINIYYDEEGLLNTLKELFYYEGHRSHIDENTLVIDELIIPEFNILDLDYYNGNMHKEIGKLFEIDYLRKVGKWAIQCETLRVLIYENRMYPVAAGRVQLKLHELGEMPKNTNKLTNVNINFKLMSEKPDSDYHNNNHKIVEIDFRSSNGK